MDAPKYKRRRGNRQAIWEMIRSYGTKRSFTDQDLYEQNEDIPESCVRAYRKALLAAGVLIKVTEGQRLKLKHGATYRLVKDEGLDAPRVTPNGKRVTLGQAQENMWRTLRMIASDINDRELAAHASTSTCRVSDLAARDYLRALYTAGYLQITHRGQVKKGRTRYRLLPARNTGPRPPSVCKQKVVYDPNEGKIVWQAEVTEEDAIYG